MKHLCSIPMGYSTETGKLKYKRCDQTAHYHIKNSDWFVCEDHLEYALSKRWPVEKIEE
jgi:hypothetical protein